jgi:nitroreductase
MAHIPYAPPTVPTDEGLRRGEALYSRLDGRRSVRFFSDRPVPRALIETAIRTASTAPSGAHMQPWTFVAVSDPAMKRQIRIEAEKEEKRTYETRMTDAWREALAPIGTTWEKPYLETVPWIVVLFAQLHGLDAEGEKIRHYYVTESCGIAAGMFITAVNEMGLSTLTHTPSPMGFLRVLLERPPNEKAMILFPVGYCADDATVPDLERKPLEGVSAWFE